MYRASIMSPHWMNFIQYQHTTTQYQDIRNQCNLELFPWNKIWVDATDAHVVLWLKLTRNCVGFSLERLCKWILEAIVWVKGFNRYSVGRGMRNLQ